MPMVLQDAGREVVLQYPDSHKFREQLQGISGRSQTWILLFVCLTLHHPARISAVSYHGSATNQVMVFQCSASCGKAMKHASRVCDSKLSSTVPQNLPPFDASSSIAKITLRNVCTHRDSNQRDTHWGIARLNSHVHGTNVFALSKTFLLT